MDLCPLHCNTPFKAPFFSNLQVACLSKMGKKESKGVAENI